MAASCLGKGGGINGTRTTQLLFTVAKPIVKQAEFGLFEFIPYFEMSCNEIPGKYSCTMYVEICDLLQDGTT